MLNRIIRKNDSAKNIIYNAIMAFISLFINGFGVYLTIHASLGVSPWDVLNIGIAKTTGIIYGNASVAVSLMILLIDILLKEPIGIAMIIDAITVGKAVDFFNWINIIPEPSNKIAAVIMLFVGLFFIGYTQLTYMIAALGCGPRDTLLVGLKKRINRIPIGLVSIMLLSLATFIGWVLGGPVGIGTIICATCAGPIMQSAFDLTHIDAEKIEHQNLKESLSIIMKKK